MQVERIGGGTQVNAYRPTEWYAGEYRPPAPRRDEATAASEQDRGAATAAAAGSSAVSIPAQTRVQEVPREAEDAVPPYGALPSTRSVLSTLTPSDRGAIAAATGFRLSPTGEIINPGGLPPWSYILGYAEHRRAEPVNEGHPLAASMTADGVERPDSSGRVDIVA